MTESETKVLIEDGLTVGGRPLRDMFEAVDHARAYDYMFTLIVNKKITEKNILYLHKLFYQNIDEYSINTGWFSACTYSTNFEKRIYYTS